MACSSAICLSRMSMLPDFCFSRYRPSGSFKSGRLSGVALNQGIGVGQVCATGCGQQSQGQCRQQYSEFIQHGYYLVQIEFTIDQAVMEVTASIQSARLHPIYFFENQTGVNTPK